MICSNCGANVDKVDSFCGVCGTSMASSPVAPAAPAPAPVFPEQNNLLERESSVPVYSYSGGPSGDIRFSSEPEQRSSYRDVRKISEEELRRPLSAFSFIGVFITLLIPVFNAVMVMWWAFSRYTNKNKRHIAAAVIIMWTVAIGAAVAAYMLMPEVKAVVDLCAAGVLDELGVNITSGV